VISNSFDGFKKTCFRECQREVMSDIFNFTFMSKNRIGLKKWLSENIGMKDER
jgi:hypothetical protein